MRDMNKIRDNKIRDNKIRDKLNDNEIRDNEIRDNEIRDKLNDNEIRDNEIRDNEIRDNEIRDNKIRDNKIRDRLNKIRKDLNDIERFEDVLLDWMRTVTIFFIAGIALYHFTTLGKPYTLVAFFLSLILMITMIVDYISRRKELSNNGLNPRLALDIMVAVAVVGAGLIAWIIYEVMNEPYQNTKEQTKTLQYLKAE